MNLEKSVMQIAEVQRVARRDQMGRAVARVPHSGVIHPLNLISEGNSSLPLSTLPSPSPSLSTGRPVHPTDNTSTKMAPVKKSKSAKSSESINSRLQLVVKSGKVSDRPSARDLANQEKN